MRNPLIAVAILLLTTAPSFGLDISDKLKIGGEFRYRHEIIDRDDAVTQHRHRIRGKLFFDAVVNNQTNLIIHFTTGPGGIQETNQTLDEGFSTKNFDLDAAFVRLAPSGVPGMIIQGGKMLSNLVRPGNSELIWDTKIRPEGLALNYKAKLNDKSNLLWAGNFYWIEERSDDEDSYVFTPQLVWELNPGTAVNRLILGGSYFFYDNIKGRSPFWDAELSYGNTLDADDNYAADFELVEILAALDINSGKIPLNFFFDYVNNTAADSLNTGWSGGVQVNKLDKKGSWQVIYKYRTAEADAVIGLFTDSQFRDALPNTDGHEFSLWWTAMDNVVLAATTQAGEYAGHEDFWKLKLDFIAKF